MPRFSPFRGLRYSGMSDLSSVVCPPYDVISPPERSALVDLDPLNCVRVELPVGDTRYQDAAGVLSSWRSSGVLAVDDKPSFYVYRMSSVDDSGVARQTTGVLGALGLEPPGTGILPHEETTPKDMQDRLDLITATRTNLSPIWGLSMAAGVSSLLVSAMASPPLCSATAEGVTHSLWRVSAAEIGSVVGSAPVVIADGHHRLQVALAYQAACGDSGGQDAVLCYVVELSPSELAVAPIHRLLTGVTSPEVFAEWFDVQASDPPDATIGARMDAAASLCFVSSSGTWLMRPKVDAPMDLDSSRLSVALESLGGVSVRYQHGWANVVSAVSSGTADAGVLLRPASVAAIQAVARGGGRMPPKTTFFTPKLATGMVFRGLDD